MERDPYPSETQDRFIVRFPDGMRDRLKEAAHANGRSMNAEIIARLQQTLEQLADAGALHEKISHLETRLHDAQQALATESALAAIVAISLKTLASNVPAELRRGLAVDAAEETAKSVLSRPLPRWETETEDSGTRAFIERVRVLVDEIRRTAELIDQKTPPPKNLE